MSFHMFIDIMFKVILITLIVIAHKVFKEDNKWIKKY